MSDISHLNTLGSGSTHYRYENPSADILEAFTNRHPGPRSVVGLDCLEFTSLCPVTGQPDYGRIWIDYVPDQLCVESKSLKLYLVSYRNHGAFHEACTLMIAERLVDLLAPRWLRIGAYWYPRGGIPIDVFWQTGAPPEGAYLPDQGVPPYRGRG